MIFTPLKNRLKKSQVLQAQEIVLISKKARQRDKKRQTKMTLNLKKQRNRKNMQPLEISD